MPRWWGENRSPDAQDAAHVFRRELAPAVRLDQAVEAVFEADHLTVTVGAGLDDGANDGVEAGGVTTPGEYTDTTNGSSHCPSV